MIIVAVVLLGSYLLYRSLGSEFLPCSTRARSSLIIGRLRGLSGRDGSHAAPRRRDLMKTPEIESYSRRTGLEMGLFVTEPNTGDFA
jgi:hypothetical protein